MSAVMLALVFIAGQLGSLAHDAFVAHSYCAEHGERVHGAGHGIAGHHADSAPLSLVDSRLDTDTAEFAHAQVTDENAPTGEAEHDHCALPITAREDVYLSTGHIVLAPAIAHVTSVSAAGEHALIGIDQYRLAPKTSPPAA